MNPSGSDVALFALIVYILGLIALKVLLHYKYNSIRRLLWSSLNRVHRKDCLTSTRKQTKKLTTATPMSSTLNVIGGGRTI